MTKTRAAFLSLLLTVLVVPVWAADVTGNWKLNINLAGVPELVCTLVQKDERVAGTCKAAGGGDGKGAELNDGRIDGDQMTWTWKVLTPDAITWTYAFAGTLDAKGAVIKGIVKLSAGPGAKQNEVSFTATKQ